MKEQNKQKLIETARTAIEAAVKSKRPPKPQSNEPELNARCGCFVTIKNGEELRGCIGNFVSDKPLIELVSEMAVAAATHDYRFSDNPITEDELPQLSIDISILSPLQKTNDPLSLELGKHGIYIRRGCLSGCFLPQVAAETGWSKEQFLSYCCSHKAGLEPNAWKDPKTEVYLFTAEIIED